MVNPVDAVPPRLDGSEEVTTISKLRLAGFVLMVGLSKTRLTAELSHITGLLFSIVAVGVGSIQIV